jgi:TetR/AcrR family transcriptional regulator, transcriptional repressor for nem operon
MNFGCGPSFTACTLLDSPGRSGAACARERDHALVRAQKKQLQAPPPPPLSFAERLELQAQAGSKRKGERTRDRLKAAAARQLEEVGYRDLRVTDINERAGVSNALFYVYFKNKEEITHEVLTEFLDTLKPAPPAYNARSSGPADTIYRGNLGYIRVFSANPGLMRCLLQFGDETPEFGQLWTEWNDAFTDRVLRALSRGDAPALAESEILPAVSALGMMVDGLLRLVFVDKHERVSAGVLGLGSHPEVLAAFLTRLWCRALYGRDLAFDIGPEEAKAAAAAS